MKKLIVVSDVETKKAVALYEDRAIADKARKRLKEEKGIETTTHIIEVNTLVEKIKSDAQESN